MPPQCRSVIVVLLTLWFVGCNRTTVTQGQKSPDGTMTLTTSVNPDKSNPTRSSCVVVDITDAAGTTLHHEVTPASDTQRWSIKWVSNDEVLLKSSDIGDYRLPV